MSELSDIDCRRLQELAQGFSLVLQCDVIRSGALRILTPFHYPNGSQIDLFLERNETLFPYYYLSDHGQTANYLSDMLIKPWSTNRRRQMMDDVCTALDVRHQSGVLKAALSNDLSDLSGAMVRLAEACIRMADISFTQRLQLVGDFQENIEEFISDAHLTYESNVEVLGKFGNVIKVDFRVRGERVNSLVQTLSTPTPTNAHGKSVELFSRWYDLFDHRSDSQFVTVFDTTVPAIVREYDFKRLQEVSTVVGFPDEQEEFLEILAA